MSLRQRSEAQHAFNVTPAAGTASPLTVVPALPGAIIKVYRCFISMGAAGQQEVQFFGTGGQAISQQFILQGSLILSEGAANLDPFFVTVAGEGLVIAWSSGTLSYDVWYMQGL